MLVARAHVSTSGRDSSTGSNEDEHLWESLFILEEKSHLSAEGLEDRGDEGVRVGGLVILTDLCAGVSEAGPRHWRQAHLLPPPVSLGLSNHCWHCSKTVQHSCLARAAPTSLPGVIAGGERETGSEGLK